MKNALQNMMRAQLIKDGKQYLSDGTINDLEYMDWKNRFEAYHSLGSNGVIDELNQKIINLAVNS